MRYGVIDEKKEPVRISRCRTYPLSFKKRICSEIYFQKKSTSRVAATYNVPLKTVESWVTQFRINQNCFDQRKISTEELEEIKNLRTRSRDKLISLIISQKKQIQQLEEMIEEMNNFK